MKTAAMDVLDSQCYSCHADGENKGGVSFDTFKDEAALLADKELWLRVVKNVRAGLMPPPEKKKQPTADERQTLLNWVKSDVFQQRSDAPPRPGSPVLRRLNRTEYRNTIKDLTGLDYRVNDEFPADDAGHGFDNIGEVLSVSPMLLEKYLIAAKSIVRQALPQATKVMPEFSVGGGQFRESKENGQQRQFLSYTEAASIQGVAETPHDGRYEVTFWTHGRETYVEGKPDVSKGMLVISVDGKELGRHEYTHAGGKVFEHKYTLELAKGQHELKLEMQPLTPNQPSPRSLGLGIDRVTFRGPENQEHWVDVPEYKKWFPKSVPATEEEKRGYARELLQPFVTRAFRRPVDDATVDRLVQVASSVWTEPGERFENGIRRAMEACLASPRFLFREEFTITDPSGREPLIDEHSLATRLSYFFWTTMPDKELIELADRNELRKNLPAQIDRLLKHDRSKSFVRNFVGQWLQARDIEGIPIEAQFVLMREQKRDPEAENARKRFFELRRKDSEELTEAERAEMGQMREIFRRQRAKFANAEFPRELREDMREETELYFNHIIQNNLPLTELLQSDYTFLNDRLARHYGLPDVDGNDIRLVKLPADTPRGGLLTQGNVLVVTSNPTRTSPVKRGLFILENILGTPPPPPPPNIPALEDFSTGRGMETTLRETLERHRQDAQCAGCHNRMDPLGLAFENFNAMGKWREEERGNKIDSSGALVSGEKFTTVNELKSLLVTKYKDAFYRCFAEKLLMYSLGRSLTWQDEATLDGLMDKLNNGGGKAQQLIYDLVNSDAFQRRQTEPVKH
jgi:hypothetical protein